MISKIVFKYSNIMINLNLTNYYTFAFRSTDLAYNGPKRIITKSVSKPKNNK